MINSKIMKKILVTDDSKVICNEICDILSMENFVTIKAYNGQEGIFKAKKHKPDLIISDIMMPIIDGYQFFKELTKKPITANIPFIFLSAKAQPIEIRKGMNTGADDYLTKPINADELIKAVNVKLEKQIKLDNKIKNLKIKSVKTLPYEITDSIVNIMAFTKYLKTKELPIPLEEKIKILDLIKNNGEKINELIDDYLTNLKQFYT